ncbi:hypothetical protein PV10_03028 [Exophiala mesophila]|uniref:RRM domain-containing protein n=1 Tax=Exophiala mesophila TaxID=212818 RepID=A0A0D2A8R1_EXOME|nr:uncharacterized protein PV10_03028 [Exophiala mesophila]KIV95363.1 hypothetical protein PV10_03028 [Exophiala mesophila]
MASKAAQSAPKSKESQQNLGNPNQTLYLKNLNEKIHKDELKRALYMLFTTYGPVLDIVTIRKGSKGQSMRGQAHVVFRDMQTSTQALRALQGFDLFGKEMVIAYGRGQSQIIPKLRGTFEPTTASGTATAGSTILATSIFNAPPPSMPSKPAENGVKAPAATTESHGLKRPREEEDEADEDEVPMDEDDSDASMEEDDDD